MREYIKLLFEEKERIDKLIVKISKSLDNAPAGSLRIAHNKNTVQYYKRTNPKDTVGSYISKSNLEEITALAKKDYDKKVLSFYKEKSFTIERAINSLIGGKIIEENQIYNSLSTDRRNLIKPYEIDDDAYRDLWEKVEYEGKKFRDDMPEIYSEKGERVRSKSEKMIADKLYMMKIPYRYEYPIVLNGIGRIYPDFVLLNVKERQEYILEHFGMMDNQEYCNKAIRKINFYESNGFYLGDKLIATFETSIVPIDMRKFEGKICKLFDLAE